MTDLKEQIAIALWHRFAPEWHMDWSEEEYQAEYRDAADAVLLLTQTPAAPVSPALTANGVCLNCGTDESCFGCDCSEVTSACNDHNTKDALMDVLVADIALKQPGSGNKTMTVSREYAEELGRQIDELEAENERLRESVETMRKPIELGNAVYMNERSPYFHDWCGAKLKVVSLAIDPDGKQWASVIEGEQRHRGNGVYDAEITDIDADHLSPLKHPAQPQAAPKRSYQDTIRCEVCDWPLANSWMDGCVPGNCSYRPENPAEQERIRKRRASLALSHPQHSGEI